MKIIEEGLKNGLFTPDGLFQSIYGSGECNKRQFLLKEYQKIPKEERLDVIQCLAKLGMSQPVERFLQAIRFAISHDTNFDLGDKTDTDVRRALVEELLSWTEIGIRYSPASALGAPMLALLYEAAFDLMYYHSSHERHTVLENFQVYVEELRCEVVAGLLEYDSEYLKKYANASITEFYLHNRRYYRMFGRDPYDVWVEEIKMFSELGLDISYYVRDLMSFIDLYCLVDNVNALYALFNVTGLKLSPELAEKAKEVINDRHLKARSKEAFLQCIDKYTQKG